MKRYFLWGLSFISMVVSLYLVFVWVPTERVMGIVQRIFYLMVPAGWLTLLSFLIVFAGSILYLAKREEKWDMLARSSAEVGIVFNTVALITGSIWAKPIWGVWWDWGTPRLTSTLVLWFVYLAYFMVRSFASEPRRGARFAAVVGIVGFLDIPIIILSTTIWQGLHPPPLIFQEGGLDPRMMVTLQVNLVAYTLLFFVLLLERVSMRNTEVDIKQLRGPGN